MKNINFARALRGLSLAVVALSVSFGASAMQQGAQYGQTGQLPCAKKGCAPVETIEDLGTTVETSTEHCNVEEITIVTTRKWEVTDTYCDGDEHTDVALCKKAKPCSKAEQSWDQTGQAGQYKMKTAHQVDNKDISTTVRTICDHENKKFVIETTTKRERRCHKWADEPVVEVIKAVVDQKQVKR